MTPADIATYCITFSHAPIYEAARTSFARLVASDLLSQEEMRVIGLKELSCKT